MTETLIKNKNGYFLRAKSAVNVEQLINTTIFKTEDEFQKAFCESNCIVQVKDEHQYISEVFISKGDVFITNSNTAVGDPEDCKTIEDAINQYEF